jgi:twitching motility protein PilT
MTTPSPTDSTSRLTATPALPPTNELIALLVKSAEGVSDIFLSPMRPPQIRVNGHIISAVLANLPDLLPDDTRRIANDLIGNRPSVLPRLNTEGSCDFSFFVHKLGRFRASIFSQRGSYAIKLRVISDAALTTFESLHLPPQLEEFVQIRSGLVVVSGPMGSGKSSTMAALLGRLSEERDGHIVTVEDPMEFQFHHCRATVLQRELYRDVPNFPTALRTSLRHPPHVIFLSTLPDRDTLDLALEAADCGHLVFAALHTPDASRTLGHLLRFFSPAEECTTRMRLARSLRGIVSQRLLPRLGDPGQVALFEILFSTPRIRECIAAGEQNVMSLTDAIREGESQNMQCFEDELKKLQKAGVIATDLDWEQLFGDWVPAHARPPAPRNHGARPEIAFALDPK